MAGPLQAEVPREFGKSLRACVCCKLVKTFDQVMRETFAAILLSLLVARATVLLVMTVRLERNRRRDQTCT